MLDVRYLRDNPEEAAERLRKRDPAIDLSAFKAMDGKRRALIVEVETLKQRRNSAGEEVARLKREKKDASGILKEMQEVSSRVKALDAEVAACDDEQRAFLLNIPNLPHATTPVGRDSTENPVLRSWGEPREFDFPPLPHTLLGEALGIVDFERAGKLAGARFSLLKGAGALLERALMNFMLDLHTTHHGYTEVLPPFMVKSDCFVGTGQL